MNVALKTECSCARCVSRCDANPGWMTPEEATRAIAAGFADKLMRDWLEPDRTVGNEDRIYLLAPASTGCAAGDAPEMSFDDMFRMGAWTKGRCVLLKDKRCTIHNSGFKPQQCRDSFGCDPEVGSDNYDIARLWNNADAQALVVDWQKNLVAKAERT